MEKTAMLQRFMLFALATAVLWAQNESRPVIQKTPVGRTSASSGKQMYWAYCAACHGTDGKGDGPASAALKSRPLDLTDLAKRNGGKFPELRVFGAINGDLHVTAHGSKNMPTWGVVFGQMDSTDFARVKLRIRNLTKYIESLQAK
jgi:mono/diheme cytochrome c family protein